jgi:two-component system OmpR family sensor kinase
MSIAAVSRFVLGHKAIVAGLWGLVVVLAIATMSWSLGNLSDEITIPDTESATVAKAAYGTFGNDGTSSPLVLVVMLPDGVAVDAAEVRDDWLAVEAVAATGEPATTGEREIRDDCDNRANFVHTEPVGPNAAGIAYVAAGVNYDAVGGSQYMWVTFAFIGFGVLAFLLAVVGSFFLVRYSLAPVTAIATAAATISEEDLSQRLPVRAGRGDELDRLARTFNDLLARLETAFADREATLDHQRRFVADASHELRTPLASILGYTRLLQRWGTERPVAHDEALEHLQREAERMQRLVEGLLLLARGDEASGLVPMPTDLASLVLAMADESMALGDDLSLIVEGEGPWVAEVDADAVRQVLGVLLDNARNHAPGAAVCVRLWNDRDDVVLEVADDGPGVAVDQLPHLFDRIYRGDSARSGHGAGLGMASAHDLVVGQGGTIQVASDFGQGTTFVIRFPAVSGSGTSVAGKLERI